MDESVDHVGAGIASSSEAGSGRQLIVGTLEGPPGAARTLDDLQCAGFTAGEITLIARVDGTWQAAAAAADRLNRFGEPSTIACRGMGTLLVGGGGVPTLRALGTKIALDDLGRAFADAGLPDADALIYELGLIRGQCLLAVRATTAERGQIAYRLLLRCGSQEVHTYRS